MPFQVISRIIGRADHLDVGLADQSLDAHIRLLQFFIAQIPYFFSCIAIERLVTTEIAFKLQMCPVIQRIADSPWQCFRKFLEFLTRRGLLARDIFFLHTIGTDHAPLIVVAAEPYLGNIPEAVIFCDLPWTDMAMIVDDRHLCCMLMIEFLRGFRLQQEILIHKLFHHCNLL